MRAPSWIFWISCLILLLPADGRAAETSWQRNYDEMVARSAPPKEVLDYLLDLPLEARTTAAFHRVLAPAAMRADNALWASRAIMVVEVLLKSQPPEDFTEVKKWLIHKGLERHQQALAALARGDM